MLIDIANLDMADQMYLNYELTKFLNEHSEGQPLAIYLRAGSRLFSGAELHFGSQAAAGCGA